MSLSSYQTVSHCSKKRVKTNHRREVVVLDFPDMEEGPQQADTACHGIRRACDASSVSVGMAHDDTAQCRQRSADSLTNCTSSECVVPPKPR